jgi:aspartate racemase
MGAGVIGIPCNTAHAPAIFEPLRRRLRRAGSRCTLLHMIEEVGRFIRERHPRVRRVGLLASMGTCRWGVYEAVLQPLGLEVLQLGREQQALLHKAIYDRHSGIKARSPVTQAARRRVARAMGVLAGAGAEAILLGCTELPLAYGGRRYRGRPVIDSTRVLERALVREAAPQRLRPLRQE